MGLFPMQIYTNFESNSQLASRWNVPQTHCFRCKFTQILKAIHNPDYHIERHEPIVSDANLHKFWKQFTTGMRFRSVCSRLFPMQIYTNFESNSQLLTHNRHCPSHCFRCKFTQILKAIHNNGWICNCVSRIVSDANLHKFWKQFTTVVLPVSVREYCFRCKFTQILKAIHNRMPSNMTALAIVSDANLHKFWKQFTTYLRIFSCASYCFRCKFTQILKAIHNCPAHIAIVVFIVSDANLHKFWKQFTTQAGSPSGVKRLFPMQIYTNFESNSQPFAIFYRFK